MQCNSFSEFYYGYVQSESHTGISELMHEGSTYRAEQLLLVLGGIGIISAAGLSLFAPSAPSPPRL